MTRTLFLLLLAMGLAPLAGCPTGGSDDDDAAADDDAADDDDATGDDDDATPLNEVTESEPNDAWLYQNLGNLPAGRTTISGTLSTAGHEMIGDEFFNGDLDLFTFRTTIAQSVSVSLSWGSAGDDLDVLLFVSLTENSELSWTSNQKVAESASEDNPEQLQSPLSANADYTLLVGNWEGDPGATYLLTIDLEN
jgi:hypothetical protein